MTRKNGDICGINLLVGSALSRITTLDRHICSYMESLVVV